MSHCGQQQKPLVEQSLMVAFSLLMGKTTSVAKAYFWAEHNVMLPAD